MLRNTIALNALLNTLKTIMGIVFPLITFPYISRVLGVASLGIYNFSASIISYFLLLASLGIVTYATREGQNYRGNYLQLNNFVSELFSINLLATVVSYLLLFILLYNNTRLENYKAVILVLSIEIFFATIGVSWVCNIFEDYLFIAIRTLIMQFVSLVLIFLFVQNKSDLLNYVWIVVFANSSVNLLNFYYVRKHYCRFRFTLDIDWEKHLKPILTIFSTTIAITIYVNSDITMLGFIVDNYQVGLYSTAVKIYTIIKTILAAMLMVVIPRFSKLFIKCETGKINNLFLKVFSYLNLLMLTIALIKVALKTTFSHFAGISMHCEYK